MIALEWLSYWQAEFLMNEAPKALPANTPPWPFRILHSERPWPNASYRTASTFPPTCPFLSRSFKIGTCRYLLFRYVANCNRSGCPCPLCQRTFRLLFSQKLRRPVRQVGCSNQGRSASVFCRFTRCCAESVHFLPKVHADVKNFQLPAVIMNPKTK